MSKTKMRHRFESELEVLEERLLGLGSLARTALADAVTALMHNHTSASELVIVRDDNVDSAYHVIEEQALELLALQTPVASELRTVAAALRVGRHFERIGDEAVSIAKLALAADALPPSERMLRIIDDMGTRTLEMVDGALQALAERDADRAPSFVEADDAVDALHQDIFWEVIADRDDPRRLEWGMRMHQVSRHLERAADHAVDVAEEVAFMVTGKLRRLPDDRAIEHLE
jgi:phosphate transport system protein